MTFDESIRASLHAKLVGLVGAEEATLIMERLHPENWSELATKTDLKSFATKEDLLKFATKEDLLKFATKDDLHHEIAAVEERTELRREAMEHRLVSSMTQGFADVRIELHQSLREFTLRMTAIMVPAMMAGVGLAFTAAKLA